MKKNKNNGKQGFVRPKNRGLCVIKWHNESIII